MNDFFGKLHHTTDSLDSGGVFADNNFSGAHSASNGGHADIIANYLQKNYTFKSFCDIGGSIGKLASILAARGIDSYVIDGCSKGWNDNNTGVARDKYAVFDFRKDITSMLPKNCFDITTSFEFTEHISREDIDNVFKNIQWISPIHVCSLHVAGAETDNHYNVSPLEWWVEFLSKFGDVKVLDDMSVPTFGTSKFVEVKFF